ncbi:alkaline phosphatase family protein [Streptomyces sp. NPDC057910]|uniref:alkaline phosphatase family protein n=1 Tax=Streptomyces sp. NPDC057910 TaxID=3346278 RepID=UPI0036E4D375
MSLWPAGPRRVLVVGIDGVRFDMLAQLHTPHLDSVADAGFLAPVMVDPASPTLSGPGWATITTGVGVAKHGVYGNHLGGNRLDAFPDFTTRLAAVHRRRTLAVGGWEPLFLNREGGALFKGPSRLSYIAPREETPEAWEACDDQVTAEAEFVLSIGDDPQASFVYLGATDETAHFLGCGEEYRRAIARADRRLGRLLAAVQSRPGYDSEQWTVIVVTDHGHVQQGGHGGSSEAERTAWIAAQGPGIPSDQDLLLPLQHADVAAHVYASLDITPDPHWALDGRPFAFATTPELLST